MINIDQRITRKQYQILLVGIVVFLSLWGFTLRQILPFAVDSPNQRILLVCIALGFATIITDLPHHFLESGFIAISGLVVLHMLYLNYLNESYRLYLLPLTISLFILAKFFNSWKSIAVYVGLCSLVLGINSYKQGSSAEELLLSSSLIFSLVTLGFIQWIQTRYQSCLLAAYRTINEAEASLKDQHEPPRIPKDGSYRIIPSRNKRKSSDQAVLNLGFPPGIEMEEANSDTIHDVNKQVLSPEESFEGYLKSAQSERIACFGEMAGGIAHEINNPLAIVRGLAEIMHKKARTGSIAADEVATSMERMFLAVDRIVRVVSSIQIFAKTSEEMPLTAISLSEVLSELDLVFCGIACNHGIEFKHEGEIDVCIDCRPGDLAQALFNIINNATEALKKTQAPIIRINVTNSQGFVYIKISNNGPVVPTNLQEKIFQPFFSTKSAGMSPGLGLSMSRAIAAGLGGDLYLEKDALMTTFILKLPISQELDSETSRPPQCQIS